jgi:hypothetical protein
LGDDNHASILGDYAGNYSNAPPNHGENDPMEMQFERVDGNNVLLRSLRTNSVLRLEGMTNTFWFPYLANPANKLYFLKNNILVQGDNGVQVLSLPGA